MPSSRETLLGEAARCREAAEKAQTREVRDGLLELAQKYAELAGKAHVNDSLPSLERTQSQPAQQQQQPLPDDDKK